MVISSAGWAGMAMALLVGSVLGPVPEPRQAEREREPFLRVAGEAVVTAAPDRVVVALGVTAQAPEARVAQEQVNQAMQRVIAAIEEAGVPEVRIQTAGLSLHPVYSQPDPRRQGLQQEDPRIIGFRASNVVRVQVDQPGTIASVIDAGLGAGANQLQGISFELADDTLQRAEALGQAVGNARRKAEALAQAGGVELGALQRIEEAEAGGFEPMHRMASFADMESGTPVQPGEVRVRAQVVLTYRIAPSAGAGGGPPPPR